MKETKVPQVKQAIGRIIRCLGLFVVTLSLFAISVSAEDFETEVLSVEEQNVIWETLNLKFIEDPMTADGVITTFDVCDSGRIVIGLDDNLIVIFNEVFQRIACYKFDLQGNYYLFWSGKDITMYCVRQKNLITFTTDGSLVCVRRVIRDSDMNNAAANKLQDTTSIEVSGQTYYVRKTMDPISNLFTGYAYHELVCSLPNSEEILVYSTDNNHHGKVAWGFIIALGGIGMLLLLYVLIIPKRVRRKIGKAYIEKYWQIGQ